MVRDRVRVRVRVRIGVSVSLRRMATSVVYTGCVY